MGFVTPAEEKLGNIIEDEKPIAKKLRAHIKID